MEKISLKCHYREQNQEEGGEEDQATFVHRTRFVIRVQQLSISPPLCYQCHTFCHANCGAELEILSNQSMARAQNSDGSRQAGYCCRRLSLQLVLTSKQ